MKIEEMTATQLRERAHKLSKKVCSFYLRFLKAKTFSDREAELGGKWRDAENDYLDLLSELAERKNEGGKK